MLQLEGEKALFREGLPSPGPSPLPRDLMRKDGWKGTVSEVVKHHSQAAIRGSVGKINFLIKNIFFSPSSFPFCFNVSVWSNYESLWGD